MQQQVKEFMIINGQYPCDEGIVTLLPFRIASDKPCAAFTCLGVAIFIHHCHSLELLGGVLFLPTLALLLL